MKYSERMLERVCLARYVAAFVEEEGWDYRIQLNTA